MSHFAFDKYSIYFHDQSMVNLANGARGVSVITEDTEKIFNELVLPMIKGHEVEVESQRKAFIDFLTTNPDSHVVIQKPGPDSKIWGFALVIPKTWNDDRQLRLITKVLNDFSKYLELSSGSRH